MIIPDINLLFYVLNQNSPEHKQAFEWWRLTLESDLPVGILSVVGFGIIRVATNPRILRSPLTVQEAFKYLDHWLSFPTVSWIDAESDHYLKTKKLLLAAGTGGNLVTDAQIAAITIQRRGTLYTNDLDFARFPDLSWKNPIQHKPLA